MSHLSVNNKLLTHRSWFPDPIKFEFTGLQTVFEIVKRYVSRVITLTVFPLSIYKAKARSE